MSTTDDFSTSAGDIKQVPFKKLTPAKKEWWTPLNIWRDQEGDCYNMWIAFGSKVLSRTEIVSVQLKEWDDNPIIILVKINFPASLGLTTFYTFSVIVF